MSNSPVDDTKFLEMMDRFRDLLSDQGRTEVMTEVGRRVGVALEETNPPYPPASGKPLTKFYPRMTAPRWKYKKKGGRYVKTGQVLEPPKAYLSKFKNRRQQGYFFNALSNGQISVPTRRTGTLGKSISSAVLNATPTSVDVSIGTNIPYAELVIDEEKQSHYHKGTWWTLQGSVRDRSADVRNTAARAVISVTKKKLKAS